MDSRLKLLKVIDILLIKTNCVFIRIDLESHAILVRHCETLFP